MIEVYKENYLIFKKRLEEFTCNFTSIPNDEEIKILSSLLSKTINKVTISDEFLDRSVLYCGTGRASVSSISISSFASLIVAFMGYKVIKTGSESFRGKANSAMVFRELGFNFDNPKDQIENQLRLFNITYVYSPNVYPWLKDIKKFKDVLDQEIIFRVFDCIDTNEVNSKNIFVGINTPDLETFYNKMNIKFYDKITLIHGETSDPSFSLDEASTCGNTKVLHCKGSEQYKNNLLPSKKLIDIVDPQKIIMNSLNDVNRIHQEIYADIKEIPKPLLDIIVYNAAILISSFNDFKNYINEIISDVFKFISSGKFNKCLNELKDFNQRCGHN